MNIHRFALALALSLMTTAIGFADEADDAAEAMVKKLGGSVRRDDQRAGKPIVGVVLSLSDCTDADLQKLAGLKSLESLALYRTAVTDTGLKELAGLTSLKTLDLIATKVTDAGMKELAGLKSLEFLHLGNTAVT